MLLKLTPAILLGLCAVAHADVTQLRCNQTGPTEYKISFALTGKTHTVELLTSTKADPASPMQSLLKTDKNEITVQAGKPGERVYFFIKADTGEQREVSIRHLPLEGTPNFRDLGGYETADGRFVRWGLVYRSGVLTYLTPADFTYLSQAGIHVVCDFRTQQENAAAPEKWVPGEDVEQVSLPIGTEKDKNGKASVDTMFAGNPTAEQLRATMIRTYSSFAFSAAPQYAKLMQQLKDDHLPLLYHCTAGKDRTGVFSALLLRTLGVPEQTVLEDYALTNQYLLDHPNSEAVKKMASASGNNMLAHLSPEQRNVVMAADPAYLSSTLRAIDAKYGSFDNYRREELHLSDDDVLKLRTKLLMQ